MKTYIKIGLIVGVLLFLVLASCHSAESPKLTLTEQNRIADVIYRIEGGDKAKAPYGVLSVKTKNKAEARKICLASIRNNWNRFLAQTNETNYFYLFADRWCPKSADPVGNANWRKNVVQILGKDFVDRINQRKVLPHRYARVVSGGGRLS